jgi:exoribonuclease R
MIPGILQLNSKTKYGMSSRNVPSYLFRPLDTTLSLCVVGCSTKDVSTNALALITVEHWETDKLTRGTLIRILGKCGEREAEEEAILYQYASPKRKKFAITEPSFDFHRLLTGYTFNVDPVGCIDIDDVITVGDDGFIYIVIADVACWMKDNPELFAKAADIGQTFYKNGSITLPLLPIQEECSLLPGRKRRGIALKYSENGISFERVMIVNNESFTYENIYLSKYGSLLKEFASKLAGRDITDSHEWIAQIMIFYNCEVAKELVRKGKGLLRSQNPPDIDKLNQYAALGVDMKFLANKSAFYSSASEPSKHWGIDKEYCHATSPIRRFADIVNQLALMDESPLVNISALNILSTNAKKYERDIFFLNSILRPKRSVKGVVLSERRIWVPEWRRIITCENEFSIGTRGALTYSVNMDQPTWKKRMIFRFEDIDCPE